MVQCRITNWQGKTTHKKKRGFSTKKEALEWERQLLNKSKANVEMLFSDFIEIYFDDIKHRLRASTVENKHWIVDKKITPIFGKKPLNQITSTDIRKWQNELISYLDENGNGYSQTYLKSGVKRIRVHDIRHSHASLLIDMGFTPLLIAERLGHEKVETTLQTYSHLYPNKQNEVAEKLDLLTANVANISNVANL